MIASCYTKPKPQPFYAGAVIQLFILKSLCLPTRKSENSGRTETFNQSVESVSIQSASSVFAEFTLVLTGIACIGASG
jgi:hypothetical protein